MTEFGKRSESVKNVLTALSKAQAEFNPVVKDSTATVVSTKGNFKYKYATLEGAIEATDSALRANNLVVSQPAICNGDRAGCLTILYHTESEEYLTEELLLPLEKMSGQGVGSAVSYARRYSLLAMLGLAAEDDDGLVASTPSTKPNQAQTRPPTTPKASLEPFKEGKDGRSQSEQGQDKPKDTPNTPAVASGTNIGDPAPVQGTLPTIPELAAFKARATKLSKDLIAAGATVREGGPTVAEQLKSFILTTVNVSDLKQVSTASWIKFLDLLENEVKVNPKRAVSTLQGVKEAAV